MVQDTLDNCIPCQAVAKPKPAEPLSMTVMPKGPWQAPTFRRIPSGSHR